MFAVFLKEKVGSVGNKKVLQFSWTDSGNFLWQQKRTSVAVAGVVVVAVKTKLLVKC